MAKRKTSQFQTIRTEGALLPPDVLMRITGKGVEGTSPESYHLAHGSRLNDEISASWARLKKHWAAFQKEIEESNETNDTSITNERWLLPLFQELGYGRLTVGKSIEIEEKTYPIQRFWNNVPIHLLGHHLPLGTRTAGAKGAAKASPHSMVQEFLNRSEQHLWGFVSNGNLLRILRDNVSLSRQAFVEFDLEAMFEGEVWPDFAIFWMLLHQSRVESEKAEECYLEKWSQLAKELGTRVLQNLRVSVQDSIVHFGRGFISHPKNEHLREQLRSGKLTRDAYYRQLLRIVYRLLFLFVAEDRDLLHPSDADESAKQLYQDSYSTARLREMSRKLRGSKHGDLWHGLSLVFAALGRNEGCQELGLVGLGSFLWRRESTEDINGPTPAGFDSDSSETLSSVQLTNDDLLRAIRSLAYVIQNKSLRSVDYRNLGSEELGSVYEALLEFNPRIDLSGKKFELAKASGNERKTTGSYYTPDSLVQCLLDSALNPVVNARLEEAKKLVRRLKSTSPEDIKTPPRWFKQITKSELEDSSVTLAERALLALKIVDPACGSGHFLIAAAYRIARELAMIRTGETEPSPEDYQRALRDVVRSCVYGVDVNPMAVELCKVSLWMEAIEPGKPLSFLDNHIQCGNSLLGTTPSLLAKGIPDDAFKPIKGDVKSICSDLRKDNKKERLEYQSGQGLLFDPPFKLGNLPATFAEIAASSAESVDEVAVTERRYRELVSGANYINARLLADTWCSAFVWKKDVSDLGRLCPTEMKFREIESNPHSILPHVREEVERLTDKYQFFHWHLAFPDVFVLPEKARDADNAKTGWSRGFDVVLGNPPWERIKLLEKEWFSTREPSIANSKTAAARRKAIAKLAESNPSLFARYTDAARALEVQSHFIRSSSRFPLCGVGEINTFAAFAEGNTQLIAQDGRAGCVLPPGICTDDTYKQFVAKLLDSRTLIAFYAFTNRGYIFRDVESTLSFSLLIVGHNEASDFQVAAKLWQVAHLGDEGRVYRLGYDDIRLINPNTRNLPIFESRQDALLVSSLHRRFPILLDETSSDHPWDIRFQRMFDMSNDSDGFATFEPLLESHGQPVGNVFRSLGESMLPLYESKLVDQFNHRASTFEGTSVAERFRTRARINEVLEDELADPDYQNLPRYWVAKTAVSKLALGRRWLVGFRNAISAVADSRSVVVAAVPLAGVGNSMPLFYCGNSDPLRERRLLSTLNSFVADYLIRQKASGGNLNYYILKQLAIPNPHDFLEPAVWDEKTSYENWLDPRVLELTYTAWDLEAFALDCGYDGPPFRWDAHRRNLLRCELDAAYFHLYLGTTDHWGVDDPDLREIFPTPRHAVKHIMDAFPIVERRDKDRTRVKNDAGDIITEGTYITKDAILSIYDEMAEVIPTGQPYQTRLDPPPGPPTDVDGNFIPMAHWDEVDWPKHVHEPRSAKATGGVQ